MKRQLVIHTGPHKTATTYIQDALRNNTAVLENNQIGMGMKPVSHSRHRIFSKKMNDKRIKYWLKHLKPLSEFQQIVLSSESFSNNILKPGNIDFLQKIATQLGRELNLIYFVRDQADLINSQYCHGIRRFYRSNDFNDFLNKIFDRDSKYNERGYNLDSKFRALFERTDLALTFIPLVRSHDPFLSMAKRLQWPDNLSLNLDSSALTNSQPGSKGIWLSRVAYDICQVLGRSVETLNNRGNVIRKIAISNQWTNHRFYGFDDSTYNQVREFYSKSNDNFSQTIWGKKWEDVVSCKQKQQAIYRGPGSDIEHKTMQRHLLKAFKKMGWKHTHEQRNDIKKVFDARVTVLREEGL